MIAAPFLRDITAFSIQIALVGMGIALLLKLVRIPAGVRYAGLRLALVASLVAPWILRAPERQAPAQVTALPSALLPVASSVAPTSPRGDGPVAVSAASKPMVPWIQIGFGALLIGIAARVVWLGIGVLRLLRLKREGVVLDAPEYSELQQQLGTRATIAQVPALPQPATFGLRRPMVLLPDTLAGASSSLRRAVVAHELFHVRRRDWLSVLGEEAVRTALWFHPAILWMTSQIQLAREEIVDELTVRAIGDRRTYVEALLAFADTPGLSPAPAFAHRRQLFHRILSVSKENVMSRPRMLSSAAVMLAAVVGASWYASTLFPILKAARVDYPPLPASLPQEPMFHATDAVTVVGSLAPGFQRSTATTAPQEPKAVTPENPIPRRTRGVAPVRPAQFSSARVVVTSRVTLDRNGVVTAVVPDGCGVADPGDEHLVCAAFWDAVSVAIRQWRYDRPAQGPIQFSVTITFRPGAEPSVTQSSETAIARENGIASEQGTQDELRLLQDYWRAEGRYFTAQAEDLINRSRELERAQRLWERGLLANPDRAALEAQMARLKAEFEQLLAQHEQVRTQARADDQARVEEQLRAAHAQVEAQYRASLEQSARAAREAADALRRAAGDAGPQSQAQATTEQFRLREAERRAAEARLYEAAARLERAGAGDAPRQLVSPSGRPPLRVAPPVVAPVAIKSPKPQHSAEALRARAEGTVTLEALVDEQGRVADARVVKSIPLLDQSALDAAKQWEFKPATLNREPVPVLIQLELNFTLK